MNAIPDLWQNHFLAALPTHIQHRFLPHLKRVKLPLGMVLYDSGESVRHVYFPIDALLSLLYFTENGMSTEIAVVGNDGVVGVPLFIGADSSQGLAQVQSAGYAYQLPGSLARDEFRRDGEMKPRLLRYIHALVTQIAQTVVCNRHHTIDQHLCRWLLLALDRLPTDELVMTQERLANLLGVRRESVTTAAHRLQVYGVIGYHRGHITVLDRSRLEQLSCECYAVIKRETERLTPTAPANWLTKQGETITRLPTLSARGSLQRPANVHV